MDYYKHVLQFEHTYNKIHKTFVNKQFKKQLESLLDTSNFTDLKFALDELSTNFMKIFLEHCLKLYEFEKQHFLHIKKWYGIRIKLFILKDKYLKNYVDASVLYFRYFQSYHHHYMKFIYKEKHDIQNIKSQVQSLENTIADLKTRITFLKTKQPNSQKKNSKIEEEINYLSKKSKETENEIYTLKNSSSIYNWINKMFQKYSDSYYNNSKTKKINSTDLLHYLNTLEILIDSQVEKIIGENKETKRFFSNAKQEMKDNSNNTNVNSSSSFSLSIPSPLINTDVVSSSSSHVLQDSNKLIFPPLRRNNKNKTENKYLYNSPLEYYTPMKFRP